MNAAHTKYTVSVYTLDKWAGWSTAAGMTMW